jgi:hypothetical protein
MKSLINIIIFTLAASVIVSCKKNDVNDISHSQLPDGITQSQVDYSKSIVAKIDAFREKMNSPLKTEEMMTLDDAIWNIEALVNADIAEQGQPTSDQIIFASNHAFTLDENGMISDEQVQQILEEVIDDIDTREAQIETDEKYVKFIDLALGNDGNNNEVIVATTGFSLNFILGTYWPFNANDDWKWGTVGEEYGAPPAGKCDGTMVGVSDGSNELEWRLNHPISLPPGTSYTDIQVVEVYPDLVEQLFAERIYNGGNINDCLDDQELTTLLISADQIYYNYNDNDPYIEIDEGARPVGKNFISTEIIDDFTASNLDVEYVHVHKIRYGIPYVIIH